MNKLDIIRKLSKNMPTETEAKTAVNKTFEIIADALKNNDKVVISNFGTFRIKERRAMQARNPKTNQKVMVGPRKGIRFKASEKMLKLM